MQQQKRHRRSHIQVFNLVVIGLLIANLLLRETTYLIAAERTPAVASEYDLKLARIYYTAKYIAWPEDGTITDAPFTIGVVEPDPFKGGLQKLAKRAIKNRPIQVVLIKSAEDYQRCHILFIPKETKPELADAIVERTAQEPVLVWRDEADLLTTTGVACTFVRQGDSLLIEANPAELKRRKLEPDAQLLSLNLIRLVKTGR